MKPIFATITDNHLEEGNEDLTFQIFKEVREECQKKGLNKCYHAGDFFHNRKYQSQSTLLCLDKVLQDAEDNQFTWIMVPGNHDKADYKSKNSYLDVYRKYKSLKLVTEWETFCEEPFVIHLIPFFSESTSYRPVFDTVKFESKTDRNILITHVAINGVKNNDGTTVTEALPAGMFSDFEKVLVGHYHDKQEISPNIIYIGASHQHNFGEDRLKGISFVFEDGSIEQQELICSPKFHVVKIDLEKMSSKEVEEAIEEHQNSEEDVRIKFVGKKDNLKKIDRKKLRDSGFDVKFEESQVDVDLSYIAKKEFKAFNTDDIILNWTPFCEHKKVPEDINKIGSKLLAKILLEQ